MRMNHGQEYLYCYSKKIQRIRNYALRVCLTGSSSKKEEKEMLRKETANPFDSERKPKVPDKKLLSYNLGSLSF